MGASAFKDISDFDEKNPEKNGRKVVFIYTTAGNLYEDDDTRACGCHDPYNPTGPLVPYWKVREVGARHSVHLAACRQGGWGPALPYPAYKTVMVNGHPVAVYEYKNTTSYFLRIKSGSYGAWARNPNKKVGTTDSASVYADYTDLVNTLFQIYKREMDSSLTNKNVQFYGPDIDLSINPNDHNDHYLAGRAAIEAAKILGAEKDTCFPQSLFINYHSQNLPPNLETPDVQNKAALSAVYSLALLDYNAWPEWGSLYQNWCSRSYFRTITSCQDPGPGDILTQDSLSDLCLKVFPSPADKQLTIRFNKPLITDVEVKMTDTKGATVYYYKGPLRENSFNVNTGSFPPGYYLVMVNNGTKVLTKTIIEVLH